jgi:predicted SAM-dependent methyltransferase
MLRKLVDASNSLICSVKRHRRIKPRGSLVKINLGCGLSVAPGWINIDGSLNAFFSRWPASFVRALYRGSGAKGWYSEAEYVGIIKGHEFLHHNLDYGIPLPDESVDYVYSSHWLEHLYKEDAERLLGEAVRVLKPGGCIRICVPDLEHVVSQYHKGNKEKALEYFYSVSRGGELGSHHYLYDEEMLEAVLHKVGFRSIVKCAYQQGQTPDLAKLDNRPEETLYMEALK